MLKECLVFHMLVLFLQSEKPSLHAHSMFAEVLLQIILGPGLWYHL